MSCLGVFDLRRAVMPARTDSASMQSTGSERRTSLEPDQDATGIFDVNGTALKPRLGTPTRRQHPTVSAIDFTRSSRNVSCN
jgi:hypothetical protein